MKVNKTWRIDDVEYSVDEMKIMACLMLGLTPPQMVDCLLKSEGAVKYYKTKVFDKMNIHKVHWLMLALPAKGFDRQGCFRGEQLLNEDELERAKKLLPPIR